MARRPCRARRRDSPRSLAAIPAPRGDRDRAGARSPPRGPSGRGCARAGSPGRSRPPARPSGTGPAPASSPDRFRGRSRHPAALPSWPRRGGAGRRVSRRRAMPRSTGPRPVSHRRRARCRARRRAGPRDPARRAGGRPAPAHRFRWRWRSPFGSAPPGGALPRGRVSGPAGCPCRRGTAFLRVLGAFSWPSAGHLRAAEGGLRHRLR